MFGCYGDFEDVVPMTCDPQTGIYTGTANVNGINVTFTVTVNPWTITIGGGCIPSKLGTITQTVCNPPGFAWEVSYETAEVAGCPGCGMGLMAQSNATAGGSFMLEPVKQLWGWHV
jgi:hypothetical protein